MLFKSLRVSFCLQWASNSLLQRSSRASSTIVYYWYWDCTEREFPMQEANNKTPTIPILSKRSDARNQSTPHSLPYLCSTEINLQVAPAPIEYISILLKPSWRIEHHRFHSPLKSILQNFTIASRSINKYSDCNSHLVSEDCLIPIETPNNPVDIGTLLS
jgi:hypothetical protein